MKVKARTVLLMSAYLIASAPGTDKYQTIMDSVTAEKVSQIIRSDVIPSSGENHGFLGRELQGPSGMLETAGKG